MKCPLLLIGLLLLDLLLIRYVLILAIQDQRGAIIANFRGTIRGGSVGTGAIDITLVILLNGTRTTAPASTTTTRLSTSTGRRLLAFFTLSKELVLSSLDLGFVLGDGALFEVMITSTVPTDRLVLLLSTIRGGIVAFTALRHDPLIGLMKSMIGIGGKVAGVLNRWPLWLAAILISFMLSMSFLEGKSVIEDLVTRGLEYLQHGLREVVRDVVPVVNRGLTQGFVGRADQTDGQVDVFTLEITNLEVLNSILEVGNGILL